MEIFLWLFVARPESLRDRPDLKFMWRDNNDDLKKNSKCTLNKLSWTWFLKIFTKATNY